MTPSQRGAILILLVAILISGIASLTFLAVMGTWPGPGMRLGFGLCGLAGSIVLNLLAKEKP